MKEKTNWNTPKKDVCIVRTLHCLDEDIFAEAWEKNRKCIEGRFLTERVFTYGKRARKQALGDCVGAAGLLELADEAAKRGLFYRV